jgi:hypothetical protein
MEQRLCEMYDCQNLLKIRKIQAFIGSNIIKKGCTLLKIKGQYLWRSFIVEKLKIDLFTFLKKDEL